MNISDGEDNLSPKLYLVKFHPDNFVWKPFKKLLIDEILVNEHCDFTKKFASKKLAVRNSALQNVWREKWQETETNEKPNK